MDSRRMCCMVAGRGERSIGPDVAEEERSLGRFVQVYTAPDEYGTAVVG